MRYEKQRKVMDVSALTPREAQMMELFRSGKTKHEIAEILGVSYKTVERVIFTAQEKERYQF
jgi:DNA-binding CsgD family transcriptional regulator